MKKLEGQKESNGSGVFINCEDCDQIEKVEEISEMEIKKKGKQSKNLILIWPIKLSKQQNRRWRFKKIKRKIQNNIYT